MRYVVWILANLVYESNDDNKIDEKLFLDHNIAQVLQNHLADNYIDHLVNIPSQSIFHHCTAPCESLKPYEIKFLHKVI